MNNTNSYAALILAAIVFCFSTACESLPSAAWSHSDQIRKSYKIGKIISTSVGGPVFGRDLVRTWFRNGQKSFQKGIMRDELLYSGVDGETIKFMYREYNLEGDARSPTAYLKAGFNQEISVSKSEGYFNFKGIYIEILESSGQSFRGRVVGDSQLYEKRKREYERKIKNLSGVPGAIGIEYSLPEKLKGKLVVKRLMKGAPAEKAGLKVGDWIQSYSTEKRGEVKLDNFNTGYELFLLAGEQATLSVSRDGQMSDIKVTAGKRKDVLTD